MAIDARRDKRWCRQEHDGACPLSSVPSRSVYKHVPAEFSRDGVLVVVATAATIVLPFDRSSIVLAFPSNTNTSTIPIRFDYSLRPLDDDDDDVQPSVGRRYLPPTPPPPPPSPPLIAMRKNSSENAILVRCLFCNSMLRPFVFNRVSCVRSAVLINFRSMLGQTVIQ